MSATHIRDVNKIGRLKSDGVDRIFDGVGEVDGLMDVVVVCVLLTTILLL